MSDTTTEAAKAGALTIFQAVVKVLGQDAVAILIDMVAGVKPIAVIDDLSTMGLQVLQGLLGVLEPEALRAALQVSYAAADGQADALEAAKFGKP